MTAMTVRQQKADLRRETAAWQRAALGLLVLSVAVNTFQCGIINHKDDNIAEKTAEISRLEAKYNSAVSVERDAIQAYDALLQQIEAEQEARTAQAAAYEALGVYRYIGECTITAYCPCEKCCGKWADGLTATGIPAVPGIAAVDPSVISLGSTIVIDGQQYLAVDTGGGVNGLHVDICFEDHASVEAFGVQYADVWVVGP